MEQWTSMTLMDDRAEWLGKYIRHVGLARDMYEAEEIRRNALPNLVIRNSVMFLLEAGRWERGVRDD